MTHQPQQGLFSFDQASDAENRDTMPPFDVSLLALNTVEGLGRKSLRALVVTFGDNLGATFFAPRKKIQKILQEAKTPRAEAIAETITSGTSSRSQLIERGKAEVLSLAAKRIYLLGLSDLPDAFREIPGGPPWLFVQGNPHVLYEGVARPAEVHHTQGQDVLLG